MDVEKSYFMDGEARLTTSPFLYNKMCARKEREHKKFMTT